MTRIGKTTCVGQWVRTPSVVAFTVGTRLRLSGRNVLTRVWQTGRAASGGTGGRTSGGAVTVGHDRGFGAVCGVPITVEGRLWGVMITTSEAVKSLPLGTESRLAAFTDLAAIAIANAQARMALSGSRERAGGTAPGRHAGRPRGATRSVHRRCRGGRATARAADFAGIGRYGPVGTSTSVGGWARDGHCPT